ncbi:hypothetical protein BGX31_003727, partial [Mortierella sp. GBA43]
MNSTTDMNIDSSSFLGSNDDALSDMITNWDIQDQQFLNPFAPVQANQQFIPGPYGQGTPDTSSQSEIGSDSIPESMSSTSDLQPMEDLPPSEETFKQVRQVMAELAAQMELWNQQKAHLLMQAMTYPAISSDEQVIQAKNSIRQQVAKITIEFNRAQARYQQLSALDSFKIKPAGSEDNNPTQGIKESIRPMVTNGRDVYPDPENETHQALVRAFKYKMIPTTGALSNEIDWDRVQIEQHKDAPTLKLNLEGVSDGAIPFTSVMAIMDFLHDFESYYVDLYTKTLFDHLAWRYMAKALKLANLHHQYENAIKAVDEKSRTWAKVEEVLRHDIFKLHVMQSYILEELFNTNLKSGEVAETFVHRIESYFRAAGIPELDKAVITKVVASLPDDGREKVVDHFKRFQDIPNLKALMSFIRANPSVVLGTRSDPFAWIKEKFGKKKSNNQPNNLAQRSQEAELSNKKPFQPRGGAIRNRNGPTNNRQRSAPYKGQRDQTGR